MAFLRFMPALVIGLVLAAAAPATAQQDDRWVIKTGPKTVADTVSALTAAVEEAGATVAAVVDHAAAASKAGMDLPPTTLVIFGNPKLGTPLMQKNQRIGIDLPMRVLVWQDGDTTKVGYLKPALIGSWYGFTAETPQVEAMTGALDKLTDAATSE